MYMMHKINFTSLYKKLIFIGDESWIMDVKETFGLLCIIFLLFFSVNLSVAYAVYHQMTGS